MTEVAETRCSEAEFFLRALEEFENGELEKPEEAATSTTTTTTTTTTPPARPTRPAVPPLMRPEDGYSFQLDRMKVVLKQYGFVGIDVPGDGDCQFSSISVLLHGTMEKKDQIRAQAVAELRSFKNMYKHCVENVTYEEYCDSMARSYTWGDHLTLQALANTLHLQIFVIAAPNPPEETIRVHEICTSDKPERTVYLAYVQEMHYMAAAELGEVRNISGIPGFKIDALNPTIIKVGSPTITGYEFLKRETKKFGLNLMLLPEDEHTLFRAISSLVYGVTLPDTIQGLRNRACDEMHSNDRMYKHVHEDFGTYLYQIKTLGQPGDRRVLLALCRALNIKVTLLSLEGTKICNTVMGPSTGNGPYYLGCYRGRLYQPLKEA